MDAAKFAINVRAHDMGNPDKPASEKAQSTSGGPAYSTFPRVTTHGPRDKRCFHGKPEDWKRAQAKRTFGGKVK